ncbi:MAG: tetratricopeptide repeat protein [Acidobacteria bacterium]|nr:tetratricopeptide repeat protein [Acidobacteriota bacterium]
MDAVSYPRPEVVQFFDEHLIPLRVKSDAKPLAEPFTVKWTPTLVTLDWRGEEHHRTVGFLPPEELIPSLMLGLGRSHFEQDEWAKAINIWERLLTQYPDSSAAPEATYFSGIARYKESKNVEMLKNVSRVLKGKYPTSPWTKRASVYQLL